MVNILLLILEVTMKIMYFCIIVDFDVDVDESKLDDSRISTRKRKEKM